MKKLIVSACVALIAALNVVAGKIWEIYPDVREGKTGPEQLLEAFDGLSSGDTVLIHEGEYDLTSIKMSDSTHLTVSQPCTICGDTDGHWDDKVLFTGTLQAIGLTADVAVRISGITFYGFALGANKGVVAFKEYYDATSDSHGDECYLTNCVIRSCTANTCAGIYRGYAKDCLIENNVAGQESIGENTRLDDCVARGNKATSYYGIYDSVGLYNCVFSNNVGYSYGGCVNFHGTTYPSSCQPCVISNCLFQSNENGNNYGAAIGLGNVSDSMAPRIMDCVFRDGKRYSAGSAASVPSCGSAIGMTDQGGYFTMHIDRCLFDSNRMPSSPVLLGSRKESIFVVNDCVFTNNYSTGHAGAVLYRGSGVFSNCVFTANQSDGGQNGGVGGFDSGYSGKFVNCVFDSNNAYKGGALYYSAGSTGLVENCVFTNNFAMYNGGAVYCAQGASAEFAGCTFTGSSLTNPKNPAADPLGGAAAYGGWHTNCTFTANTCSAGSALTQGTAVGCRFSKNRNGSTTGPVVKSRLVCCDIADGAIWQCSLDRCKIHDCGSEASPYCVFFGANWATNCLITAGKGSWGIYYRSADAYTSDKATYVPEEGPTAVGEYVNCTFTENTYNTKYRLICYDAATVYSNRFENCIFWRNHSEFRFDGPINDFGLYRNGLGGCAVGLLKNCIVGKFVDTDVPYVDLGGNLIGEEYDPLFAKDTNPAKYEYWSPLRSSPAVNHVTAEPWMLDAVDLGGKPRLCREKCDIGCYEYQFSNKGFVIFFR